MEKNKIILTGTIILIFSVVALFGNQGILNSPDYRENNYWRDSAGNVCEPLSEREDLLEGGDRFGNEGTCKCAGPHHDECCTCSGGGNCDCEGHNTDCSCGVIEITFGDLKDIPF